MKTHVLVVLCGIIILSIGNVHAQMTNSPQPQVDIKVDKEYDENGNVIRYDSTYSEVYNFQGETPFDLDSLFRNHMKSFRDFGIREDALFPFDNDFFGADDFFNGTDLFNSDFFGADIMNEFSKHLGQINSLLQEFDSQMKNQNPVEPKVLPGPDPQPQKQHVQPNSSKSRVMI